MTVAIIIEKPLNTLLSGRLGNCSNLLINIQSDGQYVLHGESRDIVAILEDLKQKLLTRKANARYLDTGTTEYYQSNLLAIQAALSNLKSALLPQS